MGDKKLNQFKEEYQNIPIPKELNSVVHQGIKKGRKDNMQKKVFVKFAGVAAGVMIFVGGINISPTMASVLSDVPVMKSLVQVLTFREYNFNDGRHQANIEVPNIQGLEENGLGAALNEKYLAENKQLYEDFMKEVKDLEALGGGHLGVDSGYVIKTDNERILALGRYVTTVMASASEEFHYDTIDKVDQVLITLPSLFKDETYVDRISEYIKGEMVRRMEEDPNQIYWIEQDKEFSVEPFETIDKEQSFYINEDYQLVISFNEYEVGPGVMGMQEFVIPTEVIDDLLVSKEYIKP